jgi:hypothetical protein
MVSRARSADSCSAAGRIPGRTPCPDPSFLMPLAVDGRRRRCPAFTPVIRRATRACALQPTRPPSRRSSRSCASPATVCTAGGCADSSSCCGGPVFASTKRSRCARPTSIAAAVQSLSVAAKEDDVARSGWTTGAGRNLNRGSLRASLCRSVHCSASSTDAPADARGLPAVHARRAATRRRQGGRAATLRTSPAAPRSRGRDGPRRRPAHRHPTPARAQQPRDHLGLSTGHRQRRDHRDGPRAPRPNGAGHHLAAGLAGHVALGLRVARESQRAHARGAGARAFVGRRCPSGNRRAPRTREQARAIASRRCRFVTEAGVSLRRLETLAARRERA